MVRATVSAQRRPAFLFVLAIVALCFVVLPSAALAAASPTIAIDPSVSSASAAQAVDSPMVTLTVVDNGWGANEMRFSNTGGSTWSVPQAFATNPTWNLDQDLTGSAQADGVRALTAQFSTDGGATWGATATATTLLDEQVPTMSAANGWWNNAYPYQLKAVDQVGLSGVASTAYRVNAGPWTTVTNSAPFMDRNPFITPFALAGSTGTAYTIDFYSTDYAGNDGWNYFAFAEGAVKNKRIRPIITSYQSQSSVTIDSAAPTTTATGFDTRWHRNPVTVSFSATDHGQSGVGFIEYSVTRSTAQAPGPWTKGDAVVVSQPGENKVWYQATDLAQPQGNVEAARSVNVKITPTTGPVTLARDVTATHDKAFKLRYKIVDKYGPRAMSVVVKVRDSTGVVVKTFDLGTKSVDKWFSVSCKLSSAGSYAYTVYAKDTAGISQHRPAGSAKITIK